MNLKEGVKILVIFGFVVSIEVSNFGGIVVILLGLLAEISINGYDGFGMSSGCEFGYDFDFVVSYEYDLESDFGLFNIQIGGEGICVGFIELDVDVIVFFGLQDVSLYSQDILKGQDVVGKINGVEVLGNGQFL